MLRLVGLGIIACFPLVLNCQTIDVSAYGVMPNGERKANVKIVREEVERTTLLPLLPYVFFDEGSALIPNRYHQFTLRESRVFSEQEFGVVDPTGRRNSIAAYYNILNIVGKRLVEAPSQSITITGSTDGKEGMAIAIQRARAVQTYLHSVFSIDTSRLVVKGLVLPATPTRLDDEALAMQENRRVTISGDWDIVRPVIVKDTTTSVSPPGVEFEVKTSVTNATEFYIRAWQLDYDDPLYLYEHIDVPKSPRIWHLDRDPSKQPTTDEDLEFEAEVADDQHRKYQSDTKTIPVEQITLKRKKSGAVRGSTELHQYNLILFDFASNDLRADHQRIIDSVIASDGYVFPYSIVSVTGFADSTGSDETNLKLSAQRANSAAERIRKRFSTVVDSTSVQPTGLGKWDVLRLPDGQALPETRMYSRTVHIIVQNRRDR